MKKKKEVILTLRTFSESKNDVKCHVRYSRDYVTEPICGNKISDSEHVIELPSKTIYDPGNKFLKIDILICELYFASTIHSRILRPVIQSTIEKKNESVL